MQSMNYGEKLQSLIDLHTDDENQNMSKKLMISLIEKLGGEESFLKSVAGYDIETEIGSYGQLDKDADVSAFFKEHKADIMEHLLGFAPRFDQESAIEFVAYEMRGEQNCDDVAEAFHNSADGADIDPEHANIQRFAIASCLDNIHIWYIVMHMGLEKDGRM